MKPFLQAARMLLILTVLTGVAYPLLITAVGGALFPYQANGSLERQGDTVIGSALIGQANEDSRYVWGRPSAVNYMARSQPAALGSSGASNLSSTSKTLAEAVVERAASFRTANGLAPDAHVPAEMLFASGSGLDPHISPEAARLQVARVARERGLPLERVAALVESFVEAPQFGIFGQPRVNVLRLNIALDGLKD
ncbi:MAG TPA: K(+)-transporting ATPase subunit C [Aggregatilineales bacterium]|nr:K(+)-transporting ATPase subunit C [Anaerolineales bacterium]HRE47703.1 K(+)-transporting ATPase subunit C [Aggregatilineales bacterium]